MNADQRTPGQQGLDEEASREPSQQDRSTDQQPIAQDQGGSMATGQASYGNSGETDTAAPSQSSAASGQEGQGRDTSLFQGSPDDLGSSGTGRSGIEGSIDSVDQTTPDAGGSTGRTGIEGSLDSVDEQNFESQGQGALTGDAMGSPAKDGTTDIEVERSQGRESDIEGSSL